MAVSLAFPVSPSVSVFLSVSVSLFRPGHDGVSINVRVRVCGRVYVNVRVRDRVRVRISVRQCLSPYLRLCLW